MSEYFETIYAWKCKGTHHKLAMEALSLLSVEHADEWSDLFLKHVESYLTGSKDPDNKFKDFKNHVLHVGDHFWGGAISATEKWYAAARQSFADGNWQQGVYSAGVMSHYFTDIFCPLHTGQSERENVIHRACEWSVSVSFDDLMTLLETELGGFPTIKVSSGDQWLQQLMEAEATHSHFLYNMMVESYNFDKGVKNPPAGLDDNLQKEMALTLGRASAALAVVLDRCLQESGQKPPGVSLSLYSLLSTLTIPIFWVTKKMANTADRNEVTRIYNELRQTGKVEKYLPEENRVIRELVKKELLGQTASSPEPPAKQKQKIKIPAQPQPHGSAPANDPFAEEAATFGIKPVQQPHLEQTNDRGQEETGSSEELDPAENRCYLRFDSPIVDAPSIGPKTASRFRSVNIHNVHAMLTIDADSLAKKLNTRWITPDLIEGWQQQAQLMCSVPGLRGHDAQLLQGVGVQNYLDLANATPEDLLSLVADFAHTPEGERIIRSGKKPDLAEVQFWINNARQAMANQAA